MRRLIVLLSLLVVPSTSRADVLVLEQPGLGSLSDPQEAVDQAAPGSTLLFLRGTYGGFTVDRGLTLQAAVDSVTVEGTVVVQGLPEGETLRLVGFDLRGSHATEVGQDGEDALRVVDCEGTVIASGCTFTGGKGATPMENFDPVGRGGHGVRTSLSTRLVLLDSQAVGGRGSHWPNAATCCTGGEGGSGVSSTDGQVVLYGSQVTGGAGGSGGFYGGTGGAGLLATGPVVLASGSTFQGGSGGTATDTLGVDGGDGGAGLYMGAAVQPSLIENTYVGGSGGNGASFGQPGQPGPGLFQEGGPPNELLIDHRGLSGPRRPLVAGGDLPLQLEGRAGDTFYLAYSRSDAFRQVEHPAGVWFVPTPPLLSNQPVGTLPMGGELDVVTTLPTTVAGQSSGSWIVQAYVRAANGKLRIGGAMLLTVLAPSQSPDCNGNGVWDLLDIVGGAPDFGGDGVIDTCDSPFLYVDASAPSGGDGSQGSPFQDLSTAFQEAGNDVTIRVQPGIYEGAGNHGLVLDGRRLTVEGLGQGCELRPGNVPAFQEMGATGAHLTLRNLTTREAHTSSSGSVINGFLLPVHIENCTFSNNSAEDHGGALRIGPGSVIEHSTFTGNRAGLTGQGLGGAIFTFQPLTVGSCVFDHNEAAYGGAIHVSDALPGSVTLAHNVFRANKATVHGGALNLEFDTAHIDNCFFALNEASLGGGALCVFRGNEADITSSTFVGNIASGLYGGGALLSRSSASITLDNSILWGNMANMGPSAALSVHAASDPGLLTVRYTNLEGGSAAVPLTNATLIIGSGTIDTDPGFMNPALGDYRLGSGSPCIDAGSTPLLAPDRLDIDGDEDLDELVPLDLLLAPRSVDDPATTDTGVGNPVTDMGALEYQP